MSGSLWPVRVPPNPRQTSRAYALGVSLLSVDVQWELIAVHDLGPTDDGRRMMRVDAIAHMPDGHLRWVKGKLPATPEELECLRSSCKPQ